MRACVRACVRVRACACVCARVRASVCVRACVRRVLVRVYSALVRINQGTPRLSFSMFAYVMCTHFLSFLLLYMRTAKGTSSFTGSFPSSLVAGRRQEESSLVKRG